ncbi:unnamed protein product [Cylindrotheca closterium]|uniref:Carboxypeptidase n=1 Tax=Cylindrotheca closterium TaxID=2856 RepID=A0AAD2CR19_9STRA|nr:unnamed protein product [Cylindrotheca closterium]
MFHSIKLFLLWQLPFALAVRRIPDGHWGTFKTQLLAAKKNHHRQTSAQEEEGGGNKAHRRVTVDIPASPDGHLVTELPLLDKAKFPTSHWAGLLPVNDDGQNYFFYWLFAPDDGSGQDMDFSDRSIPLVIWLNGGPACSSMDGLWLENGPFRLTENADDSWSIELDEYSWHKSPAFVLYIDQPVGTGISFTTNKKYPSNDEQVNMDFYYFLNQFLTFHKDKFLDESSQTLNRPLYFSGESHAGHYIPSMMNYIQKQNAKSPSLQIPLSGAAIGNGWIDPPVQYSAHEAAYGKGIIGLSQKRALEDDEKRCQQDLAKGKYVSKHCYALLDAVIDNSQGHGSLYHISQYDARKTEKVSGARDFPKGHKDVEAYLGGGHQSSTPVLANLKDQVLKAIHATPSAEAGQEYEECTDPPYNALKHQDGLGVTHDVVDLLNNDVRMMFFNGIEDMICNHVGNEIAVENFEWKLQKEYQLAPRYGWRSPSTQMLAGFMKEHENLMYLKVKDSGHMVPMDLPDVALDLIRTLIYNKSFEDYEQRISRMTAPDGDSDGTNCPICLDSSDDDEDEDSDEDSDEESDDDDAEGTQKKKTCPKCPACSSKSKIAKKGTPELPQTFKDWATTSPTTLIGGSALIAWALAFCMYMACFRRKDRGPKYRPANRYDMEMTSGGYSDKAQADLDPYEEEPIEFS